MIKKIIGVAVLLAVVLLAFYWVVTHFNLNTKIGRGEVTDSINGVYVYHNGGVNQSSGRNLVKGYNVGIKYQCVEFVKRYYLQFYHHKMPDAYGHAKDFFDKTLPNGRLNAKRGLIQYRNGEGVQPQTGDLLVFGPSLLNPYGHVAIVSKADHNQVEIIQQNSGPWGKSREEMNLTHIKTGWKIENERVLGWLRMSEKEAANSNTYTE